MEEAPLEPDSFGVVTFSHSLEHLQDPVSAVRKAGCALRAGGLLHIAVPHWNAAKRLAAGKHVPFIHAEHISYFTKQTLGRAVRAAGFEPTAWQTLPFLGGPDYLFAAGFLRRLRLEWLLMRFLKMGDRPLEELIANDVRISCPHWRFRVVFQLVRYLLWLWPERFLCNLGWGEELRVTAAWRGVQVSV